MISSDNRYSQGISREVLTPDQAEAYLMPACVCASIHKASPDFAFTWIVPFGSFIVQPQYLQASIVGRLERRNCCYYNPETYLKVMVTQNHRGEIWITFGAIGSALSEEVDMSKVGTTPAETQKIVEGWKRVAKKTSKVQYRQAYANLLGKKVPNYEEAAQFVENLLNDPYFIGKKVFFTGQCLGGSIAQYCGIKFEIPTICFNTLQLGVAQQHSLGNEKIKNGHLYVTHVSVEKDYVSDPKIEKCRKALQFFRIPVPRNFGERLYIPSAYEDRISRHDFFLGSLMQHIGHTNRTKACELPEEVIQRAKDLIPNIGIQS